jgi:hypothetical protein
MQHDHPGTQTTTTGLEGPKLKIHLSNTTKVPNSSRQRQQLAPRRAKVNKRVAESIFIGSLPEKRFPSFSKTPMGCWAGTYLQHFGRVLFFFLLGLGVRAASNSAYSGVFHDWPTSVIGKTQSPPPQCFIHTFTCSFIVYLLY